MVTIKHTLARSAAAVGVSTALLVGVGVTGASANFPGDSSTPPTGYCSPSLGCVGQINGHNVYAHSAIKLTAKEQDEFQRCQWGIVGAVAAGISRNPAAVLGAVINGYLSTEPNCAALQASLKRRGVK